MKRKGTTNNEIESCKHSKHEHLPVITFQEFPDDVVFEISTRLDAASLSKFLSTSKRLWKLRHTPKFAERIDPYRSVSNWSKGLEQAVRRGNLEQFNYFIAKSQDDPEAKYAQRWGDSLMAAAEKHRIHMMKAIIEEVIKEPWSYYNPMDDGLAGAARGGHIDLVDYFLSQVDDPEYGLQAAVEAGHTSTALHFFRKATLTRNYGYSEAFVIAAKNGNKEVVKAFIEHGATLHNIRCHSTSGFGKDATEIRNKLIAAKHPENSEAIELVLQTCSDPNK